MVYHLGLETHSMMTPHQLLYDHFDSCCNLLYLVMVSLFIFYYTFMFSTFWGKSGGDTHLTPWGIPNVNPKQQTMEEQEIEARSLPPSTLEG
jgi:hypothetical protein